MHANGARLYTLSSLSYSSWLHWYNCWRRIDISVPPVLGMPLLYMLRLCGKHVCAHTEVALRQERLKVEHLQRDEQPLQAFTKHMLRDSASADPFRGRRLPGRFGLCSVTA